MRLLRLVVLAAAVIAALPATAGAVVPAGFQETTVWTGLVNPTSVRFADDGRVFVAEKRGRILEYDSLADPTPTVFADLSTAVHDFWDRGLLGMALDPRVHERAALRLRALHVQQGPVERDGPALGRRAARRRRARRPTAASSPAGSRGLGPGGVETPLITDWCQQYPSHSVGDLVFGPGGALYVSAGDGASFNFADYGQDGAPVNPCGDPPGGTITPPTAEGGALRSQDVRTTGDATGADGAILRVNPDTGDALPDNPAAGAADPMARRIVAHGFRNPFRLTLASRHRRGLGRRRRLERVGGGRPPRGADRRGRQLRLAVLRGRGAHAVLRQPEPEPVRDALRAGRRRARRAALHLPARRQGDRGRGVPVGHLVDRRPGRSTPAAASRRATATGCSSPTTRAAACGSCRSARTACPTRRSARASARGSWASSTSSRDRTARSTTPTSTTARCGGSATARRTTGRPRAPPRRRRAAACRWPCSSTARAPPIRTATRSPTPGTSTATAPTTTPPARARPGPTRRPAS